MTGRHESQTDDFARLRHCLEDLAGIMALPTVWAGGEPPQRVATLLETLRGLDGRLAQRTSELAKANVSLTQEVREARLIVDGIPGLVATLTPSGELDGVNHRMVEYCGRPVQELKQWATNDTIHPEDRPGIIQLFAALIASGLPSEWESRIRRFDGVY